MLVAMTLLSSAAASPLCRTPALRFETSLLRGYGTETYRPDAVGFVDSERFPIRVHYRRARDAERAVSVYVPALEQAWEIQIEQGGWPAPPPDAGVGGSDAFDVYVTNEKTYGGAWVWGWGPDVIDGDDWYSVPSFMAVDESIADSVMVSWMAHELNHASQYAMDAAEGNTFVWESTAEVMADLVDDDGNVYIDYDAMEDFQEVPFLSLAFDGSRAEVVAYNDYSFYEYGGILFGMFLEERYGRNDGATLLTLWDDLAQEGADFLTALHTVDPEGASRAELYTEFAVWRMFTGALDDGDHFEEARLWGPDEQVAVEQTIALSDADGFDTTPSETPYDLGTVYYVVDLGDESEDALQVEVTGDDAVTWGIAWAVWYADGTSLSDIALGTGGAVEASIPLVDATRVQFGVVNAGGDEVSAVGPVERRSFDLALSLGTDEEARRCGCDTNGPGTSWLLAGWLPLVWRRRTGAA